MSELENQEFESKVIKTTDENGKEHNFELIDILELEGQEYGLLVYLDSEEASDDDEEQEVVVMKLFKDEEGYRFEVIENEVEFAGVLAAIEEDYEFEDDENEEGEDEE